MRLLLCLAAVSLSFFFFFASSAGACIGPPPNPPDVWIIPHGEGGACGADLNNNGVIDTEDVSLVLGLVGPCLANTSGPTCPGDLNDDGVVDPVDVAIVQAGALTVATCEVDSIWITLHDYESFGANPGQFCTCALSALGPIVYISQIDIVDSSTGEPVPGFGFDPNDTTSSEFNGIAGENMQGFLSDVSQAIPAGLSVDIRVLVSVPTGTPLEDLQNALTDGQPPLVATDEGDASGVPQDTHQAIVAAGNVMIMGESIPTLPMGGTIALLVLLVTFFLVAILRSRTRMRRV